MTTNAKSLQFRPGQTEVRCAVRFPLHLPVKLVTSEKTTDATTVNVSASGVLFSVGEALAVQSPIGFSLRMPGSALGTKQDILVQCSGRVVRCSTSTSGYQVAATIDEYRFTA